MLVALILIVWISALASSFIDNIPFTTATVSHTPFLVSGNCQMQVLNSQYEHYLYLCISPLFIPFSFLLSFSLLLPLLPLSISPSVHSPQIPIIVDLAQSSEVCLSLRPLVWALAFGACLGGQGSNNHVLVTTYRVAGSISPLLRKFFSSCL